METWKPVVGWEGFYDVSDQGRVLSKAKVLKVKVLNTIQLRRLPARLLVPAKIKGSGGPFYAYVCLYSPANTKKIPVHTLVASAFIGPRPQNAIIDHIDRNSLNNNAENLRYTTLSENFINSNQWETCSNCRYDPSKMMWKVSIQFRSHRAYYGYYYSKSTANWAAHFFKRHSFLLTVK